MPEPGLVEFVVEWDKHAVATFQRIVGKNGLFGALHNWKHFFYDLQKSEIIQDDIRRNINTKKTPDGWPWAGLSMDYALRKDVGHFHMEIPETSPIMFAYVNALEFHVTKTTLRCVPNTENRFERRYDLALRFGWRTSKGFVPGREWFGISKEMEEQIKDNMELWMNMEIDRRIGDTNKYVRAGNPFMGLR